MDVEKILSILQEIIEEEEQLTIQTTLAEIASNLSSDNSEEITELLQELEQKTNDSVVNEYSYSKLKVLKKINGEDYFGTRFYLLIKQILDKDVYKIKENLNLCIKDRNQLLSIIKTNATNLEELSFKPYYETITETEIGLIIPETQADLKNVTSILKEWNFILKNVGELCDKKHGEPKIYSVQSSSIGLYILGGINTIFCILAISDKVLDMYKKVLEIKKLKINMEKQGFKDTSEADAIIKTTVNEDRDKIVETIMSKYGDEGNARNNELRNAINISVGTIIEMRDAGIVIEVNPPKIDESEQDTEDNADKGKKNKKTKEELSRIKQTKETKALLAKINAKTKQLSNTRSPPLQIKKYLSEPPEKKKKKKKTKKKK